jgi:hypothetical protein
MNLRDTQYNDELNLREPFTNGKRVNVEVLKSKGKIIQKVVLGKDVCYLVKLDDIFIIAKKDTLDRSRFPITGTKIICINIAYLKEIEDNDGTQSIGPR